MRPPPPKKSMYVCSRSQSNSSSPPRASSYYTSQPLWPLSACRPFTWGTVCLSRTCPGALYTMASFGNSCLHRLLWKVRHVCTYPSALVARLVALHVPSPTTLANSTARCQVAMAPTRSGLVISFTSASCASMAAHMGVMMRRAHRGSVRSLRFSPGCAGMCGCGGRLSCNIGRATCQPKWHRAAPHTGGQRLATPVSILATPISGPNMGLFTMAYFSKSRKDRGETEPRKSCAACCCTHAAKAVVAAGKRCVC